MQSICQMLAMSHFANDCALDNGMKANLHSQAHNIHEHKREMHLMRKVLQEL